MIVSTYFGDGDCEGRVAQVCKDEHGFYVDLYYQNNHVEKRTLYNHSERYAEDCAENYVMGIFHIG